MSIFQGAFQVQKGAAFFRWARIISPLVSNEVCMYGSKKETRYPTAKVWESLMRQARWRFFFGGTLLANGGLSHWLTLK